MIIQYSDGLDKQTFLESGAILRQFGIDAKEDGFYTLAEINNPGAALDRDALLRQDAGKLVLALFGDERVPNISQYDQTSNQWFRVEGTWPATIDTMTHLHGQRMSGSLSNSERILDAGCGNGIAGMYAANKSDSIKTIMFSDISAGAVRTATANEKFLRGGVNCVYVQNDGIPLDSGKFDVAIVSAVPCTPGYPGLKRALNPLFEGTSFLERVLRDSPTILTEGGKLLISHSSAGKPEFDELAKKYGASVDKVLFQRDNFYRVEFLGDQRWVDFLNERGGIRKGDDGKYAHTVSVKEISYQ